MRARNLLVALLLMSLGACASAGMGSQATKPDDVAATMVDAITMYKAAEPHLSAAQREEFKDACNHVSSAYQTAGILLTSFFEAEDEASAHTAIVAYRTTIAALPGLADRADQLARSFRGGAK